jgi:serine/threonine-protein kinase
VPGALRVDDVLAARILDRQAPALRTRMLEHLDALARGGERRSLLGALVAEGRLPMEAARGIQAAVERHRRGRGLALLAELLARAGGGDAVRERGRALGPDADVEALGRAVVAAGLVDAATEGRLRAEARAALERDLAGEVARYVEGRRRAAAPGAPEPLPPAPSGLFPAPALRPGGAPDDARDLVETRPAPAVTEGPRFAIPAWIDTSDPRVGGRIAGAYTVVGKVGEGGNGVVYLAHADDDPTRPLAVKVIRRGAKPQVVGRFKREALAQGLFHHPNALEMVDAGQTPEGEHYLVLEFFDGHDLAHALEARGGKLPPRDALRVIRKVLEALDAAHGQGLIHRDLKPENILVSDDLERVKLMDFGIALIRSLGEFDDKVFHTVGPDIVGTPRYMSPEQAASEALAPTSDLYSIGLVLYELLSGSFPFESDGPLGYLACHITEDPRPLAKACPEARGWPPLLHALVDSLLQKDPDDRPQTARAVIEEIDRLLPAFEGHGAAGA